MNITTSPRWNYNTIRLTPVISISFGYRLHHWALPFAVTGWHRRWHIADVSCHLELQLLCAWVKLSYETPDDTLDSVEFND